jgi:hypothetical protein
MISVQTREGNIFQFNHDLACRSKLLQEISEVSGQDLIPLPELSSGVLDLLLQHQLWRSIPLRHLHQRELELLANGADYLDHPTLLKVYLKEIRRRIRGCHTGTSLVQLLEIHTTGQLFKWLNPTLWTTVWRDFCVHEVETLQTGLEEVDEELRSLVVKSSHDTITPALIQRYPNVQVCDSPHSLVAIQGWNLRELSLPFAFFRDGDLEVLLEMNLQTLNLRGHNLDERQILRLQERFGQGLIL